MNGNNNKGKIKKQYIQTKEACEISGMSDRTLRTYADKGFLQYFRTEGGQRRFKRSDIERLGNGGLEEPKPEREIWKVAYARVSSRKQSDDLSRQKSYLTELYPEYQLISDIGSGINFQRKGFRKILEKAVSGVEIHLAVAHRDRLCRFGYELIQFIIEQTGGSLVCTDNKVEKSKEEELAEDLLAIIQVFNCRSMGRRRYSNEKREIENKTVPSPDTEISEPENKNLPDQGSETETD